VNFADKAWFVSFTGLLSTHLKENFKVKCPIDFFDYFIIIFFRDILIILLFSSKIFWLFYYYFAPFLFNRGYNTNDQLDFLTVIKRDYNTNDQLKFILSIIKRDNGLNKRLKAEENNTEGKRDEVWKRTKQEWIESFELKNLPVEDRRTNEERWRTSTESLMETSLKRYGSTSTWIFSFFLFSSLISSESLVQKLLDP